jgi:hypothetical protein
MTDKSRLNTACQMSKDANDMCDLARQVTRIATRTLHQVCLSDSKEVHILHPDAVIEISRCGVILKALIASIDSAADSLAEDN